MNYNLSRIENHNIANTNNGDLNIAPPGKRGDGTEAMKSNCSACPRIASAAIFPPIVAIATP